jgi:hypothetical protein
MTELLNEDDPNDPLLTGFVLPTSTPCLSMTIRSVRIEQGSRVVLTGCNLTAHLFL